MRLPKIALVASLAIVTSLSPRAFCAPQLMQGCVAEEHTRELTTQINWFTNLKKAEEEAQAQNKMIFWMHMVGHIEGAT